MMNSGNKNKTLLLIFLYLSFFTGINAQQIREVSIHSDKMGIDVNNIVILPDNYNSSISKKYPVIYLLHGHGGNERSMLNIKPNLPRLATQHEVIFVCPDGKVSWYWNSPINPKSQYETYISKELIDYIDTHYRTMPFRSARAVTGFSMGGHGALWMAVKHADAFGAAGSMSGGVDIRPFPRNWNMADAIGEYALNKTTWNNHTIATHVDDLRKISPNLIIDCGQDDFFLTVNESLHRELLNKKIIHTYITSPGKHNPTYWNKALNAQLAFFIDCFATIKVSELVY